MNFVKGMIVGTCVSAGIWMLYTESSKSDRKKLVKKGKKFIKNMSGF